MHYYNTDKSKYHVKHIMVWENGDFQGDGHSININPKCFRTWNGILAFITDILRPSFGAVRNLIHLESKELVNSFESLESNGKYVAVGAEKLKENRSGYKTWAEKQNAPQTRKYYMESYTSSSSTSTTPPRGRKIILFVMPNGKTQEIPCKVVLTESDIDSWMTVLEYISRSLDISEGIQYLYTVFGDPIINPRDIQNGGIYVAVPRDHRFISLNYVRIFRSLLPMPEIDLKKVECPPVLHRDFSDSIRLTHATIEVARSKSEGLATTKRSYCTSTPNYRGSRPNNLDQVDPRRGKFTKSRNDIISTTSKSQQTTEILDPCFTNAPAVHINNMYADDQESLCLSQCQVDARTSVSKSQTSLSDQLPIIEEDPSIGFCDLEVDTDTIEHNIDLYLINENARSCSEVRVTPLGLETSKEFTKLGEVPPCPFKTIPLAEYKTEGNVSQGIKKKSSLLTANADTNNEGTIIPCPFKNISQGIKEELSLLTANAGTNTQVTVIPCPIKNISQGIKEELSQLTENPKTNRKVTIIPYPFKNISEGIKEESSLPTAKAETNTEVTVIPCPFNNSSQDIKEESTLLTEKPETNIEAIIIPCPYKSISQDTKEKSSLITENAKTNKKVTVIPCPLKNISHDIKEELPLLPAKAETNKEVTVIPCPFKNISQGIKEESSLLTAKAETNKEVTVIPCPLKNISHDIKEESSLFSAKAEINKEVTVIPCPYKNISHLTKEESSLLTASAETNKEVTVIPSPFKSISHDIKEESSVLTAKAETNKEVTIIPCPFKNISQDTKEESSLLTASAETNNEVTVIPSPFKSISQGIKEESSLLNANPERNKEVTVIPSPFISISQGIKEESSLLTANAETQPKINKEVTVIPCPFKTVSTEVNTAVSNTSQCMKEESSLVTSNSSQIIKETREVNKCGYKIKYDNNRPRILQTPREFIEDVIRSSIVIMERSLLIPSQEFYPLSGNAEKSTNSEQNYVEIQTGTGGELREQYDFSNDEFEDKNNCRNSEVSNRQTQEEYPDSCILSRDLNEYITQAEEDCITEKLGNAKLQENESLFDKSYNSYTEHSSGVLPGHTSILSKENENSIKLSTHEQDDSATPSILTGQRQENSIEPSKSEPNVRSEPTRHSSEKASLPKEAINFLTDIDQSCHDQLDIETSARGVNPIPSVQVSKKTSSNTVTVKDDDTSEASYSLKSSLIHPLPSVTNTVPSYYSHSQLRTKTKTSEIPIQTSAPQAISSKSIASNPVEYKMNETDQNLNNYNPHCKSCCRPLLNQVSNSKEHHSKEHHSRILDTPEIREFTRDATYEDWDDEQIGNTNYNSTADEIGVNQSVVTVIRVSGNIKKANDLQRCPSPSLMPLQEDDSDLQLEHNGVPVTCYCRTDHCQCQFTCRTKTQNELMQTVINSSQPGGNLTKLGTGSQTGITVSPSPVELQKGIIRSTSSTGGSNNSKNVKLTTPDDKLSIKSLTPQTSMGSTMIDSHDTIDKRSKNTLSKNQTSRNALSRDQISKSNLSRGSSKTQASSK